MTDIAYFVHNGHKHIGFVVGFGFLKDASHSFNAHTGIDIFAGKFFVGLSFDSFFGIVLTEYVVPYFYITVVFDIVLEEFYSLILFIVFATTIIKYFGIGATWSRTYFPVVAF